MTPPPNQQSTGAAHPRRRPAPLLLGLWVVSAISGCTWLAARPPAPAAPAPQGSSASPAPPEDTHKEVDVRMVRRALSSEEAAEYLGDSACASCHREIHAEHSGSRHRRTLRRVSIPKDGKLFRKPQKVTDPLRNITYRPKVMDGKCIMEATDGVHTGRMAATYVLGSGKNGLTFLGEIDPNRYTELRISYYPTVDRWYFTPSQSPAADLPAPAGTLKQGIDLDHCVLCHSTVVRRDYGQLNLKESDLGIGCERCHGPGRAHVQRIRETKKDPEIERLRTAGPGRINQLCGVCHRSSENSNLEDLATRENLPRFQGLALEQSECYKKSGKLSCITCHSPHQDADTNLAKTDATCRSCHTAGRDPHQTVCPVSQKSGCTECHMPEQSVSTVPFVRVRNHFIKVWAKQSQAAAAGKPGKL